MCTVGFGEWKMAKLIRRLMEDTLGTLIVFRSKCPKYHSFNAFQVLHSAWTNQPTPNKTPTTSNPPDPTVPKNHPEKNSMYPFLRNTLLGYCNYM